MNIINSITPFRSLTITYSSCFITYTKRVPQCNLDHKLEGCETSKKSPVRMDHGILTSSPSSRFVCYNKL